MSDLGCALHLDNSSPQSALGRPSLARSFSESQNSILLLSVCDSGHAHSLAAARIVRARDLRNRAATR